MTAPREGGAGGWPRRSFLVGLTLAALALYLFRAEAKSIWWDESLSLYRAQLDIPSILSNRITYGTTTTVDLHPPLYFLLLHGVIRALGESDLALRLPSAFCGALLVPLLYAMGRRLRGEAAGLAAAGLGAMSPFVLWYAQEARMYTMVTLLGLLSLYCLWRAVAEQDWHWALGLGLSAAAGLATQYLFALVLAAQGVLGALLWAARRPGTGVSASRESRRRLSMVLLGGLLLLVAVGVYARTAWGLKAQPAAGREFVPLPEMLRDTLNSFSLGASVDPQAAWPLDLVFLAVFLVGAYALWRRPPRALAGDAAPTLAARLAGPWTLLGTVLTPVLGIWGYSLLVGPIYMGSRYVIMSSPAFALGLGVGIDALRCWKKPVAALAALLLVAAMGVSTYRYFTHPAYRTKEDYASAARLVMAREAAGDAILLTAPENITAFAHYYQGRLPVFPVPSVALSGPQRPERIEADLRAVVEQGYRRVWLVHCRTMFSDPEEAVTAWLEAHALLLERMVFPSVGSPVTVSAWLPGSPLEGTAPPGAVLGVYDGRLALQEVALRSEPAPGEVTERQPLLAGQADLPARAEAGRSITVALRWSALAPLGRYKVSLRLYDAAGVEWAQQDSLPYMYLSTEQWPLGSAVRQDAHLRVPPGTPPGGYRLQFVLYEEANGRALPFRKADGGEEVTALDLGEVTVVRSAESPRAADVLAEGVERARVPAGFGRDLELWAWQAGPEAASPGGRIFLHLFWRARRAPAEDYRAVVNLCDEAGRIWHTETHSLTGGDDAPADWSAGELRRGIVAVDLPADAPTGRTTVHLLVYAPASQRFLWVGRGPWPWTGRQLTVGAVEVR